MPVCVCVLCVDSPVRAASLCSVLSYFFRVWGKCGAYSVWSTVQFFLHFHVAVREDLRKKHGSCSRENSVLLLSVSLRMELVGSKVVQEEMRNRWKLLVHAFLSWQDGALSVC
jgi:hypothetical protein